MTHEEEAPTSRLPWGLKKDSVKPGTIKQIAASKMQTFHTGVQKKTPFQKRKEEEELKRKKAEEEAAEVYKEFVASFEEEEPRRKTFVKAGASTSSDRDSSKTGRYEARSTHRAQSGTHKPVRSTTPASGNDKSRMMTPNQRRNPFAEDDEDEDEDDKTNEDEAIKLKSAESSLKKRNLGAFMENLKRRNKEQRLQRKRQTVGDSASLTVQAAFEGKQGSHDLGDPTTTNLFVSNIPDGADELTLCKHFGRYGPIGSVKIMWPRPYDDRASKGSGRLSGFVAFMNRDDAAQALKNLDGSMLLDNSIRCVWGKAVPLPDKPIYVTSTSNVMTTTGRPFNARVSADSGAGSRSQELWEVVVEQPTDRELLYTIHRTIERVIRYGAQFEAINNAKFKFLYDYQSPEHVYYRWRLFSLLNGDSTRRWSERPFEMFDHGTIWIPPESNAQFEEYGSDTDQWQEITAASDAEYEHEREQLPKGQLGPVAKRRLSKMIRLYSEGGEYGNIEIRGRIGEFALEHTDSIQKVIDIVMQSLLLKETPYPVKAIRFELVSELLVRSGQTTPGAWKIRSNIEARLTELFTHLGQVAHDISSRLKAENYKRQIFDHLRLWESQSLFTREQLDSYVACFEKTERATSTTSTTLTIKERKVESVNITDTAIVTPKKNIQQSMTSISSTKPDQPIKRAGFCPIGQKEYVDTIATTSINHSLPITATSQVLDVVNSNNDNDTIEDKEEDEDLDGEVWTTTTTTTTTINEPELDGEPMMSDHIETDEEQLDGEPLNEEEEEEEDLDGVAIMDDTSVIDLPTELADKLERYRVSLSVIPQMTTEKQEALLEEFRKKLLSNESNLSESLSSLSSSKAARQEEQSVVVTMTRSENNNVKKEQKVDDEDEDDFDMFA
ncbi:hypothetical protein BDF22DRAFT_682551 [Syncephalis plumigaleata]|nr:hypothetical protein BDF22DRAFT_682551 [Syncephalis plumigaleata]